MKLIGAVLSERWLMISLSSFLLCRAIWTFLFLLFGSLHFFLLLLFFLFFLLILLFLDSLIYRLIFLLFLIKNRVPKAFKFVSILRPCILTIGSYLDARDLINHRIKPYHDQIHCGSLDHVIICDLDRWMAQK